jgi:D-serine dehydratase
VGGIKLLKKFVKKKGEQFTKNEEMTDQRSSLRKVEVIKVSVEQGNTRLKKHAHFVASKRVGE